MHVSLCHIVLTHLKPLIVSRQEYAFSLATSFRLNYEGLSFFGVKLLLEILDILRQQPSLWEEVEFIRECLFQVD